jgi:TonB-linked SusC/RagA family outer membrane protein
MKIIFIFKPNLLLWGLLTCFSFIANAQTITGKVTGADNNEVLPGVSVTLKGTTKGTTTNPSGEFSIDVQSGQSTLVFSFVGYVSQEISIGSQTRINVSLVQDSKALDEVVVVGYGTVKKSDLTGSLSSIKSKEINAFPTTNVLQALNGRASGVQVLQNSGAPGAAVSVRIRGTNSVRGDNEPLYVIDGFPTSQGVGVINNSDIESIEVLKDASATAIYGSRGANGVVLITTKQGKSGKVNVDFESTYSIQTLRKKMEMMNAKEFGEFYNLQAKNDNIAPRYTQAEIDALGEGYDWQSEIFRKAPMLSNNLTINGGNEKTRYSIGGSILGQEGIIINSDYNRYVLRANVSTDFNKKFNLSYNANLSSIKSNRQNSSGGNRGGSLISSILSNAPVFTPYNADGTYNDFFTRPVWISISQPFFGLSENSDKSSANRVLANLALTFKPFDGLSIKIAGGIENRDDRNDSYSPPQNTPTRRQLGGGSVSTTQGRSLLSENTISYIKTFGKHSISTVAGFTFQDFLTTSLGGSGVGFLSDKFQSYNLGAAITPGIPSSSYSYAVLLSGLGRINYSYDNKYLATASWRADGSSRYSVDNKWGYFPSAALAWRVSEEGFLKNNNVVSDLKIRASWGSTGSQAINPYATLNILSAGKTTFDNTLYNSFAPSTTLPGNLKWETTEQIDFGVDASFIKNRYRVALDYYIKNTRDLLNVVQLPSGLGFTSTIRNVGQIQNKGLEVSVDARVIDKELKWDIGGNISFNRNKVIKLQDGRDIFGGNINVTLISDNVNLLREGQPMNVFFGYQEDGYTDKGQVKYKDLDGNGVINQLDKSIIGNPNPNYIFGLNSTVSYKGFDLSIFLQGSQGNDIVNISSIGNTLDYAFGLNMTRDVYLSNWTPSTPNAKYPIISRVNSYNFSDRLVEDGSYVRLRDIQLAYTLPLKALKLNALRSAQIFASGQNLLTFTKYSWWDPEVNSLGSGNSLQQGIDWYTYPTAKTMTMGIRLGF